MIDSVRAYQAAHAFALRELGNNLSSKDAEKVLSHYLNVMDASDVPKPIETIYFRMIASAQNANMMANVIGGSIGGIENLGRATFAFDPRKVLQTFGRDHDRLFLHIRETLKPSGKLLSGTRSLWPRYCRTAISAAAFLDQFKDGEDFFLWANHFYRDPRSMPALPLVISQEIFGFGYPLACDFLKDLGFIGYGKPDVHIKRILVGLGLADGGIGDYGLQKLLARIANDNGVPAYTADKLFWLVGSGKYYDHPALGKKGRIGRNYKQFLSETAPLMSWWDDRSKRPSVKA